MHTYVHRAVTALLVLLALPAAGQDALTRGDAAYARRAEGARGAVAAAQPIAQAVAAYREAVAADPQALEPRWKLLRALYFKGEYATAKGDRRSLFEGAKELAEESLDLLAERVGDRLSGETAPAIVLQELCRVLFREEGFRGNADAYYDPRNSFLNDVLDRRLGIPITLGIVVLEVGRRAGLPLSGINFPGHFLVRYDGEVARLLVDPFDGGRVRWEDEGQELLDRVYGGMVRMRDEFLRPASRADILARVLTNLKGIYLNARDDARALAVDLDGPSLVATLHLEPVIS